MFARLRILGIKYLSPSMLVFLFASGSVQSFFFNIALCQIWFCNLCKQFSVTVKFLVKAKTVGYMFNYCFPFIKNVIQSSHTTRTTVCRIEGSQQIKLTIQLREDVGVSSFDMVGKAIWASSSELIQKLQNQQNIICGQRILEVGSGTGICGLAAAALGANLVVLTDWKPNRKQLSFNGDGELDQIPSSPNSSILSLLEQNVLLNSGIAPAGVAQVRELEWGNQEHVAKLLKEFGRFDAILGSEVLYTQGCATAIIATLPPLMHRHSSALLVSQRRFGARKYLTPSVLASAGLNAVFSDGSYNKFDHVTLSLSAPAVVEPNGSA